MGETVKLKLINIKEFNISHSFKISANWQSTNVLNIWKRKRNKQVKNKQQNKKHWHGHLLK